MPQVQSVPVILLALANDRSHEDRYLRNLPDEHRQLRDVLRTAQEQGLCEVVDLANATADDIIRVFQSAKYRNRVALFHFGGHASGFELLLESTTGSPVVAQAGGLANFLGQQLSLRIVFLNGCSTRGQTEGLLDAGIQAVIATATAINDAVATQLAVRFYRGLASGTDLQTAFHEATAAARMEAGASTRALYAEAADGQIVDDRLPWELSVRPGAESISQWNLPDLVQDPLFGLPGLPEQDLEPSPFRHLHWFRREQAELFFGRGHEIRDLYHKVTSSGTAPIILFYGQSGVGKSSLLDAGLIPRLDQSQTVSYLRRDQQQGLAATLQMAFLPEGIDLPPGEGWRTKEAALDRPLTIILDQVEEVYTRPCGSVSDELKQFLANLDDIFHDRDSRPQGRLILSFRKEWLAEIKRQLSEARLPYTEVFLERLERPGVIEAITGPMRSERLRGQYRLSIEPGLADIIADDLLEDDAGAVAPTLQVLLSRMWEDASRQNAAHPKFARDLYQSLRRQGVLLRDFLSQQLKAVEQRWPETVSPDLLLDLLSLHTTHLGTAEQCSLVDLERAYSHHAPHLRTILDGCKDAYLLTVPDSSGNGQPPATRLAHDTLAPLVRERFEQSDHPGQRARRTLENRSVDWERGQVGAVLDDQDLDIVEEGREGMRVWTPDEVRLIEASRSARTARLRGRRILKALGALAVVAITITAGIAAWFAVEANHQRQVAVDKQQEAHDEKLDADQQRTEAQAQQAKAETALARSFLIPLRERNHGPLEDSEGRNDPLSDAELDSLWELSHVAAERTRDEVLHQISIDPKFGERVAHRSEALTRALIGLDPRRRSKALGIIYGKLQSTPSLDWRTTQAFAAIATELRPLDPELEKSLASALFQRIKETSTTENRRLLGDLSCQLLDFVDQLSPDEALEVVNLLLKIDLEQTGQSYPPRIGLVLNRLTARVDPKRALQILRGAWSCHEYAQFTELAALEVAFKSLAERVPEQDAIEAWHLLGEKRPPFDYRGLKQDWYAALATLAQKSEPAAETAINGLAGQICLDPGLTPLALGDALVLRAAAQTIRPELRGDKFLAAVESRTWKSPECKAWFLTQLNAGANPHPLSHREQAEQLLKSGADLNLRSERLAGIAPADRPAVAIELAQVAQETLDPQPATGEKPDEGRVRTALDAVRALGVELLPENRAALGHALSVTMQNESDPDRQLIWLADLLRLGEPLNAEVTALAGQLLDWQRAPDPANPTSRESFLLDEEHDVTLKLGALLPAAVQQQIAESALRAAEPMIFNEFQNDQTRLARARLYTLPAVEFTPPDDRQAAAKSILTYYRLYLHTNNAKYLPVNWRSLNPDQTTRLLSLLDREIWRTTNHSRLVTFAALRSQLNIPLAPEGPTSGADGQPAPLTRHQLLMKLSVGMYRLPPAFVNTTSPPVNNSHIPKVLSTAILAALPGAAQRDRTVAAHAVMHAMLQREFERESGPALREALARIISGLDTPSLLELLRSPWCVEDARRSVLAELVQPSGKPAIGEFWTTIEALVPATEAGVVAQFPDELRPTFTSPEEQPIPAPPP